MRTLLSSALFLLLLLSACGASDSATLKPVLQQKVGDYTVSVLSESGAMKRGSSQYTIEFRRTADGQLVDVGPVDVAPVMEMAGMGPMMGQAKVEPSDTPGRYNVEGNLSMAGLWKVTVKFGDGQTARFNLSAQ